MNEKAFPSIAAAARARDLDDNWLCHHLDFVTHSRIGRRVSIEPEDLDQFLSTFTELPPGARAATGNGNGQGRSE